MTGTATRCRERGDFLRENQDWWRADASIYRIKDLKLKRELLFEAVKSKDDQLRYNTMHELKKLMGAEAVPLLQDLLRSDPSAFVRGDAALLLGDLGGEGTIELLLQAFRRERLAVQITSAASLYRLGEPGPASELIPRLAADLDSPDGAVRREATERLGTLKAPMAIPLFARAMRDTNGDVRAEAASGLGALGTDEVIPMLEILLKDPVQDVAAAAREALTDIKAKSRK